MPKITALPELLVPAEDDFIAIVDSDANETKKISALNFVGVGTGWKPAAETLTYSAYSSVTRILEISVSPGANLRYTAGNRLMFDQPTDGTKYGIIVMVESNTLHVFMHEDHDADNEAITNPYVSIVKSPLGFDLNPEKWQLYYSPTTGLSETSGLTSYQQIGDAEIELGVGAWNFTAKLYWEIRNSNTIKDTYHAISTSTSTPTDNDLLYRNYRSQMNSAAEIFHEATSLAKPITLNTPTTYYVIADGTGNTTELELRLQSFMRAVCAYL